MCSVFIDCMGGLRFFRIAPGAYTLAHTKAPPLFFSNSLGSFWSNLMYATVLQQKAGPEAVELLGTNYTGGRDEHT